MQRKTVNVGNRPVRDRDVVMVDHKVQTFVVQIRSSASNVSPETLKNLIQQRHEVVSIEETDGTDFIRRV